jgi:hypothetical protein
MCDRLAVDEDTLVAPASWRRLVHPRRGGIAGTPVVLAAEAWQAVGKLRDSDCGRRDPNDPRRRRSYREQIELILRHPETDPGLARDAEPYLRGERAAVTPRGAAAGDALTDLRRGLLPQRAVAAYLMPTRADWVNEDCADRAEAAGTTPYRCATPQRTDHMLLCSVNSAASSTGSPHT